MKRNLLAFLTLGLVTLSLPCKVYAQMQDSVKVENKRYYFPRKYRPQILSNYNSVLYAADTRDISTLRGDVIIMGKDTIIDLCVNPAGANIGSVKKDKKGRTSAHIYHPIDKDTELFKFDSKHYGAPTAISYTPDARGVIVAAGEAIYFLDPKNFQPIVSIENVPIKVEKIAMSPNGYFMAIAGGDQIVIYNLEENKIRTRLSPGEQVTEIMFSPDNKDFTVLTDDGLLSIYNTRTFEFRKMVDDLGKGLAAAYNFDGKYVAVATDENTVILVNLLNDSDRELLTTNGGVSDVVFISDANQYTLCAFNSVNGIEAIRLMHLKPFYNRLIDEEVDLKMEEWLKMMPGETIEAYQARVNEETRQRQRRLFEEEAATRFAGDLLAGSRMSLGTYDRANGVLALNFDTMPTIYLPVPENDVTQINNAGDLVLSDVMYGVMPDDTFEIVYAKVTNTANGASYIYDNVMRSNMEYMAADDTISLELLQQQQMEELKLQELREKIMQEAKQMNVISDHTQIAVNSRMVPDYDASGNKILNYQIGVTYTVEPEFSVVEDFGPGKYHVDESGAASSMLNIVKEAFEGDFKQYLVPGKKMKVRVLGTADAAPILRGIPYDGSYGDIEDEPVYVDGQLQTLTVTRSSGIKENEQLAFLRAIGVRDYLEKNVKGFKDMNKDYTYDVKVSKDKGSQHRRITLEMTFIDAY